MVCEAPRFLAIMQKAVLIGFILMALITFTSELQNAFIKLRKHNSQASSVTEGLSFY